MAEFKLIVPKEITGKSLQFDSVESFQNWINQERSSYEWVSQVRRNFSNHVWTHITQQFAPPTTQIRAIQQNLNGKTPIQGNIDAIYQWFESTYKTKKLLLSTSSEIKAVNDIKSESLIKASVFLGHMLGVANLYANGVEAPEMIDAANDFFQYISGLSKRDLLAEKQALEELKKEWDQHLTDYKTKEDLLEAQFQSSKTNFDEFFANSQSEVEEHLAKHTSDLEELKKTYDQFMALKAPVEYWKSKRQKHKESVDLFKKWSISIGIIGAVLFALFVPHSFADNDVTYWKVAIFVFLGTLFFWAMRVLVKLMLSHIHLEGDAHEREVMCQTYLALLRDKTGLEENDKKLILTTLFRPSSSGIMGEDGIPPGLYDVMTKIASK